MPKIIQPISDPDEIRQESESTEKEKFTDYYVDAPAPDPLTFKPPTQQPQAPSDQTESNEDELTRQNDPLKDFQ